jgi:hypothetical protein
MMNRVDEILSKVLSSARRPSRNEALRLALEVKNLRGALDFALRHCATFRDGTKPCESGWHDKPVGRKLFCLVCSGSTSNRRQVPKYTCVSERVAEMLAEKESPELREHPNEDGLLTCAIHGGEIRPGYICRKCEESPSG